MLLLCVFILTMCLMPTSLVEKMRGALISWLPKRKITIDVQESERLRRENHFLRMQLAQARTWLLNERRIETLCAQVQGQKESVYGRVRALAERLRLELSCAPAQVIFRSPSSWSNVLWIDVGEENNGREDGVVVAKNSPVIAGDSLLGIVECVGPRCARVRLITDPKLTISVCAHRVGVAAKGEVHGSGPPLWRAWGQTLKGVGFASFAAHGDEAPEQLAVGDLLVTNGLDGIFPAGLRVGTVVHADEATEGAPCYGIEARLANEDFIETRLVTVLPPLAEAHFSHCSLSEN